MGEDARVVEGLVGRGAPDGSHLHLSFLHRTYYRFLVNAHVCHDITALLRWRLLVVLNLLMSPRRTLHRSRPTTRVTVQIPPRIICAPISRCSPGTTHLLRTSRVLIPCKDELAARPRTPLALQFSPLTVVLVLRGRLHLLRRGGGCSGSWPMLYWYRDGTSLSHRLFCMIELLDFFGNPCPS